ncbi:MAG: bifunctional heptose 7-phosphate kinase/heptose 1-phosphate adenyltransferase [Phycisphaerales bacterium]|nr:bifunctional heptose 7-phosphate kinase/heptose 1-phosphate adenyltransferase [Phycisphaerales bacterium]
MFRSITAAIPMQSLIDKLAEFHPFRTLVIGDFMLDQYVHGAAERLSPDAPVPILVAQRTEDRPGGAANLCLDLIAFRGHVTALGVVGDDREADALRSALADAGCDVTGLVTDPDRPTTIKRSLIGLAQHRHPQKMFRVDVESRDPLPSQITETLLAVFDKALPDADAVCIEDYGKGVCTPELCAAVIERCAGAGTPVLVDPAAVEDYSRYRGATVVTPNRSEAELATGLTSDDGGDSQHNAQLATALLDALDLDAVVLTLDRSGALLLERGGEPVAVPTVARQVYDVTGAGDIVLAALATGAAQGWSWVEAVTFANAAAGLEVEVFGVQPIPLSKVQHEILSRLRPLDGKVRTLDELLIELAVHRDAGRRIVFTNGCFDVIHAGHVGYLREAKGKGNILVVAVNSDRQVRAQKGEGRPIYNERDRLDILSELQCIDYLTIFDEPTVHALLRAIEPDVYIKGGDYRREDINEWDLLGQWVEQGKIAVEVVAHRPGLGSTEVIEKANRTEPS